jgi:hypothetical protein
MEFDVMTRATTWDHVATLARRTEAAGFSGMLFTEGYQVPWMNIAAAAQNSENLTNCCASPCQQSEQAANNRTYRNDRLPELLRPRRGRVSTLTSTRRSSLPRIVISRSIVKRSSLT